MRDDVGLLFDNSGMLTSMQVAPFLHGHDWHGVWICNWQLFKKIFSIYWKKISNKKFYY